MKRSPALLKAQFVSGRMCARSTLKSESSPPPPPTPPPPGASCSSCLASSRPSRRRSCGRRPAEMSGSAAAICSVSASRSVSAPSCSRSMSFVPREPSRRLNSSDRPGGK